MYYSITQIIMKRATVIAFVLALLPLACDVGNKVEGPSDFIERISVAIDKPVADPLDHALSLIGLAPDRLEQPRYLEANYHLACRNPLIDKIAQSPLYLHHWADTVSSQIQQSTSQGLYQALNSTIQTLNGGVAYNTKRTLHFTDGCEAAYIWLCEQNGVKPDKAISQEITQAGFTAAFDVHLGQLIGAVAEAANLNKAAFAQLSPAEQAYILSLPERFFYPDGKNFTFLSAPTHTQIKLMQIAQKIDFKSLFIASLLLADAADRFSDYLSKEVGDQQANPFFNDRREHNGIVLEIPSPIGDIVILGHGNNVYDGSGALVVDLGGDDHYRGPIAGNHLLPGRVSIAIDIQGNDRYTHRKGPYAQGFGCLGVGLLVDLEGSDEYFGNDVAQGCGLFGVGVLADMQGRDTYNMGLIGQGFGLFGVGLLMDNNGEDHYLMTGMGQGVGSTMGCGVLSDGAGKDKYLADRHRKAGRLKSDKWCHTQGAGLSIRSPNWSKDLSFYGGIGILSEGGGDDFYHANGGNCMGSSYFMSVGALVDHGGDDKYIPEQGYGIGFAVHLSNAALIDRAGNDLYLGKTHTGGVGSDRSVAILADYAGDDIYGPSDVYVRNAINDEGPERTPSKGDEIDALVHNRLAGLSYGAAQKHKALGFLIDYQGNDKYYGRQRGWGESCGGVMPPQYPQYWSHAVLLDLAGKDFYYKTGAQDNRYFKYHNHGICYDTEYTGSDMPGKQQGPNGKLRSAQRPVSIDFKEIHSFDDALKALHSPDLFLRFAAIGKLERLGVKTLDQLVQNLLSSTDIERNRDIVEVLSYFYEKKKINQEHIASIVGLLDAPDPFIRKFTARLLGWLEDTEALPFLAQRLDGESGDVQVHIIWALGNIGSYSAVSVLKPGITSSAAPVETRQMAVEALSTIAMRAKPRNTEEGLTLSGLLLRSLDDPDDVVRAHAALGLGPFLNNFQVAEKLHEKLQDQSIYVRRASAKTLILGGLKEGIPILIETLQFPSIDTFEFYDEDLIKDIAFYCGVDFPDDQRYVYQTWKNWWHANNEAVNLGHNLNIKHEIEAAFATYPERSGMATFERLMQTEPDNAMIQRRFRRFCRDRIRYLLSYRKITSAIIARCVVLQQRLVMLEPDNPKAQKQLQLFEKQLADF